MPAPRYRFFVYDLMTLSLRAVVPFTTFEWTQTLSTVPTWTATLPIDHPKATRTSLAARRSMVVVMQANLPVFAGIMWDYEVPDDEVKVSGTGMMGYYAKRTLQSRQGMTYADTAAEVATLSISWVAVDQFRVVADMFAHAAAIAGGGNVAPTSVRFNGGSSLSGVTITRQVWGYEGRFITQVLDELVRKLSGIEWKESYDLNTSVSPPRPRWYLDLAYPRLGQAAPAILFDEARGASFSDYHENGLDGGTVVRGFGAGTGDGKVRSQQIDSGLIYPSGSYPYLESVASYNDLQEQALLDSVSIANLRAGRLPVETFTVELRGADAPQPGDYAIGDSPMCRANRDGLNINGRYRAVAITTTVDDLNEATARVNMATNAASLGTT